MYKLFKAPLEKIFKIPMIVVVACLMAILLIAIGKLSISSIIILIISIGVAMFTLITIIRYLAWQGRIKKEGLDKPSSILCSETCPYVGLPEIAPYSYSDEGCLCPCRYYDINLITNEDAESFRCQACIQKIEHGKGLEKIPDWSEEE